MHGHELLEMGAAIVLSIAGLIFVPAGAWMYLRRGRNTRPNALIADQNDPGAALRRSLMVVGAALSLGAAVIHFAAVGPHLEEFAPYAYAFAALGVVQVALSIGLLRGWPHVPAVNIALSAAVIGVWIISRTVGLPFGAEPWQPEEIGVADIVATAFEAGLIAVLALSWMPLRGRRRISRLLADSMYLYLVPIGGIIGLIALIAAASLGAPAGMHMAG